MVTLVPGQLPCSTLWMAALLLWLRTGALGGEINPNHLQTIIQYITAYGVNVQYAFAVSLPTGLCRDPSGLAQELPKQELQDMYNTISQPGSLYNPATGHIVAARVNRLPGGQGQHTEWRLLSGGQNSPVQQLLARTYQRNSCLIFFTLNSPCLRVCLRRNRNFSILQMVRDTFRPIGNNYKAFVFQQIYNQDTNETRQNLLSAWRQLRNVPLLRCNNNGCRDCMGDDTPNRPNPCLEGMPTPPPHTLAGAVGKAGGTVGGKRRWWRRSTVGRGD